jgi:hypothetical protein
MENNKHTTLNLGLKKMPTAARFITAAGWRNTLTQAQTIYLTF